MYMTLIKFIKKNILIVATLKVTICCFILDPKFDTEIVLDNHKVIVPQGKVINQPQFSNSSFSQSEYLIYREDQCRIRFILKLKF